MNKLQIFIAPIGRCLLVLMFIASGIGKINAYSSTQEFMDSMGVPGILLPLVIALELVGGIAVFVGFQARLAALALAGFTIVSAILFHADFSNQMQMMMFMKNITIAGGFLMIVAHGAGAYSLDNRNKF